MPYIKQEDRPELFELAMTTANQIIEKQGNIAGNFNFFISTMIAKFLENPSYGKINEIVGVLECVKLELYRRVAGSYEDLKAKENGDVYPSNI